MKNVCFTGHRKIDSGDLNLKLALDNAICGLYNKGATEFYCGGALGWDTLCANMVLYLKKRKAIPISLHLVLPCSPEYQTAKWSDADKRTFYSILEQADSVEYISDKYYDGCMKKRNQRLVDLADWCVCYYKDNNPRSGTGQTVRMAQSKGIEIINIAQLK